MDYILNGQGMGDVASTLIRNGMDPGVLRPFEAQDGRTYVTRNGIAVPVLNATASLRRDDWIQIDRSVIKAAQPRLKAVSDLRSRGLEYTIPNGMGRITLDHEKMGDISDAAISMDGMRESKSDQPQFDLSSIPLPIIHKDFQLSARQVMASRNGGSPLDTTGAELAGRKVAESAEKLLIGALSTYTFGGGTIYGYKNFASALTRTITSPTASGWSAATTLTEVLQMRQDAYDAYHYGPFVLYASPAWDVYMDADYSTQYPGVTLRQRIQNVEEIEVCRTLDYQGTGYTLILVQMTSDVARMLIGMEIQTVQWESKGGMQLNFKVMGILVPHLRADINGNTGIVYGSTA